MYIKRSIEYIIEGLLEDVKKDTKIKMGIRKYVKDINGKERKIIYSLECGDTGFMNDFIDAYHSTLDDLVGSFVKELRVVGEVTAPTREIVISWSVEDSLAQLEKEELFCSINGSKLFHIHDRSSHSDNVRSFEDTSYYTGGVSLLYEALA